MEGWNTYCTTAESLVRTKLWLMGHQGTNCSRLFHVSHTCRYNPVLGSWLGEETSNSTHSVQSSGRGYFFRVEFVLDEPDEVGETLRF
jgi:hypothetical protein